MDKSTAASTNSATCLCLGPKHAGKTHLLVSLQSPGSITNVSHSVPTIGTNIFTIKFPDPVKSSSSSSTNAPPNPNNSNKAKSTRTGKIPSITIMEIGGEMAPMWTDYLQNVTKILYVIDTSNLCQISAAGKYMFVTVFYPVIYLLNCFFFRCFALFTVG